MKTLKNIFRLLTFAFALTALVLFFVRFVGFDIQGATSKVYASGAQLAFGSTITDYAGTNSWNLYASSHLTFCFFLTVITALTAGLNFTKSKNSRFVSIVFALISGIYMLVIALSDPAQKYIDYRQSTPKMANVNSVYYWENIILYVAIALLACAVFGIVFTLIADYLACKESKDKLTIPKRIAKFFREYKSEIKKIVWPGPKSVVKNTAIVLIMCLIVGAFIWLVDYGLGNLIKLILA